MCQFIICHYKCTYAKNVPESANLKAFAGPPPGPRTIGKTGRRLTSRPRLAASARTTGETGPEAELGFFKRRSFFVRQRENTMLNFEFFSQQAEVKRALSSRLNHNCMETLRYQDRKRHRSHFSEVVWLIPSSSEEPDYRQAVPAVSKDLSIQGISLVHNRPITDSPILIGVPGEHGFNFFECNVEHCSRLGYGFYQIGLFPMKVVSPSTEELKAWQTRTTEFETEPEEVPEPVTQP